MTVRGHGEAAVSARILIVDDDERLADMVRSYLTESGYSVELRHTAASGIQAVADRASGSAPFDAVILDVMLPDLDGLEVCRRLRAKSGAAILMLSARGEDADRIVGLEIGADDYLPKPFNPRELQARLKAILRRRHGEEPDSALRFGRLTIDPGSRTVRIDDEAVALTSYQFDLLLVLAQHAGRVLSRERLLDLAKGAELDAFDRSIDVHVSRIRAAIKDDPAHPRRIITVRGSGYLFAKVQDQA